MKPTPPSLSEIQSGFSQITKDPRGAGPAVKDHPSLEPFIAFDERASRVTRLSVYAEGYFSRLVDSLSGDFPNLKRILDHSYSLDAFPKLIADFLQECPSQVWNIGDVGRRLPAFLARHEILAEEEYLADLAKVEWAVIEAFYSENVAAFDSATLRALPPDAWPGLIPAISPSVRTLTTWWNTAELWHNPSLEPCRLDESATVMIWRNGWRSDVARLSPSESTLYDWIRTGFNLGSIGEKWPDEDPTPVMEIFNGWMTNGILAGIKT